MPKAVALAACAIGALMIVLGLRLSRLARDTRGFTRTQGRIVAAELEELPRPAEEGGTRFKVLIRYAFEARGRTHESEQVSVDAPPGAEWSDAQEARRAVERHPPGSAVDVWFDPADPRRSVLVPGGARAPVVVAVALGLALVAAGIFGLAR